MRKNFVFVFVFAMAVSIVLSATTVPAFAYTVTGDLSSSGFTALSGDQSYAGSLAGLFDVSGNQALYINNGSPYSDMWANQDYIVATNASGQAVTFGVGEISVGNQGSNITITGNATTGYTISGYGQTLSGVTNLNVVHVPGVSNGNVTYTTTLTITGNFTAAGTTTFTPSNFPGSYTLYTEAESQVSTGNHYTGVCLYTLLQQAGVNMSNYNQYFVLTGSDNGKTVLTMDEVLANNTPGNYDLIAYELNGSLLSSSRGYFRSVETTDDSNSRSLFTLANIDVESSVTPIPPSVYLFGTGLLGFVGLKRKFGFMR
ncbi:MAG TPA: hypothetical protein VEF34_21215 [Syntrophobacteraceae bacterium]|nr:hypothetical protein [Syntrophobacteraceae bacterium]